MTTPTDNCREGDKRQSERIRRKSSFPHSEQISFRSLFVGRTIKGMRFHNGLMSFQFSFTEGADVVIEPVDTNQGCMGMIVVEWPLDGHEKTRKP